VSFQITILKVLAGHPEGRAPLEDLKRDIAILVSSGPDWTTRMKRLAARAPDLDIFGQMLVVRDAAGWQITSAGRALLDSIETRSGTATERERSVDPIETPEPRAPRMTMVGVIRRGRRSVRSGRRRPNAAA
jgi:hypothetical protein